MPVQFVRVVSASSTVVAALSSLSLFLPACSTHLSADAGEDTGTADADAGDAGADGGIPGDDAGHCPPGFGGPDCLLIDPSLSSIVPSVGALNPVFDPATTMYVLAVPTSTTSVALTPTVTFPEHATITVDGNLVDSGTAATADARHFRTRVVTVTTDGGAMRSYTVVIVGIPTYIKASNTDAGDAFGTSVALSADGTILAVGAQYEDSSATGVNHDQGNDPTLGTNFNTGAVYIFTRTMSGWSQTSYIKASNTGPYDGFGTVVSLSADGTTLAVGAPYEDSSATGVNNQASDIAGISDDTGAVYVFRYNAVSGWSQEAYVKASHPAKSDFFGGAVALSGDGATLAVGAAGEDSSATGINGNERKDFDGTDYGAVYVFKYDAVSGWSQEAYVKASNAGSSDTFGAAVSLSNDGSLLAVGAPLEDSSATGIDGPMNDGAGAAGAVYVFTRAMSGWSQTSYIKASNTNMFDYFGSAVSLSSDGTTLAVGATGEASNATGVNQDQGNNSADLAGAVYVFTRTTSSWSQEAYIKSSHTAKYDNFGYVVSLSGDGSTLAVSADFTLFDQSHGVYVFARAASVWSLQTNMEVPDSVMDDEFGSSISLSSDGSTLAVGGPYEDSNATGVNGDATNDAAGNAGAVYVY